jgi:hypothetical protein
MNVRHKSNDVFKIFILFIFHVHGRLDTTSTDKMRQLDVYFKKGAERVFYFFTQLFQKFVCVPEW